MSIKGQKLQNGYLLNKDLSNSKYHLADENGKFYLCDCGKDIVLRDKLGLKFRKRFHKPTFKKFFLFGVNINPWRN